MGLRPTSEDESGEQARAIIGGSAETTPHTPLVAANPWMSLGPARGLPIVAGRACSPEHV